MNEDEILSEREKELLKGEMPLSDYMMASASLVADRVRAGERDPESFPITPEEELEARMAAADTDFRMSNLEKEAEKFTANPLEKFQSAEENQTLNHQDELPEVDIETALAAHKVDQISQAEMLAQEKIALERIEQQKRAAEIRARLSRSRGQRQHEPELGL